MLISGETIKDPYLTINASDIRPMQRSPFESNAVAIRPNYTRTRRKWILKWDNTVLLPESDYQKVRDICDNVGVAMTWTHPVSGEYTVFTPPQGANGAPYPENEVVIPTMSGEVDGYRSVTWILEEI